MHLASFKVHQVDSVFQSFRAGEKGYYVTHQSVVRNSRKEEVALARLPLVHTRVTHSYLLLGEEQPQCVGCEHHSLYVTSFWSVAILHK